jgi:acyl carrier protein
MSSEVSGSESKTAVLEAKLAALISERLLELPPDFHAEANLYQAGLDSMGIMQLLLAIEDEFGILLPEADVSKRNFCTVRNLSHLLEAHLLKDASEQ